MRRAAEQPAILSEMHGSLDGAVVRPPDAPARLRRDGRLRVGSLAVDVALVSGLSLALGLFRLGAPSFWVDEAFTAREMGSSVARYIEVYHWLYYSLLRPWTELVGTGEWALRFPSVVGAMAASGLIVVLGRKLFDRRVGLAAGLVLAVNPLVVQWSQQARGYTFMVALAVLATLLLVRALELGTRSGWAIYGVAFTALVVWHPVAGTLLVPAHSVLALQRRERVLPHGLLAVVIVGALGVPWAAQLAMRSTGEGAAMNWLKAPSAKVVGQTFVDISGLAGLGALLALVALALLLRARESRTAAWLATWAVGPFVVALLVSIGRPIFLDRYLLVAAPAFALLAGVALVRSSPRYRAPLVALVLVVTVVGLVQWYGKSDGNWRGEDWRGAVAMVQDRRGEAGAILVVPWSAAPAARYYGADVQDVSTADSIWVLRWSESAGEGMTPSERRALGFGEHELVERQQFGWRVSAQLWRRPG
mgnify:CR=1 FL=1